MNERYGKNTAPAGKTRKSAAAAKPKRPASSGASDKGSSAGKGAAGKGGRKQIPLHPPTPEYRFWRRVWLGLMVLAMALVGASFWLMQRNEPAGTWVLIATYAVLGVGVFLDFYKLRKMRLEWAKSGGTLPEAAPEKKKDKNDADTSSADSDES